MVRTETVTIRGTEYTRNYSDAGYMIERDGVEYAEAIDPLDSGRVYTETEHKIEPEEEDAAFEQILEEVKRYE